jgi:hypothetical protein
MKKIIEDENIFVARAGNWGMLKWEKKFLEIFKYYKKKY